MKFESCGFGFGFLLLPPEHQLHTFIYLHSLTHFFFDEEIIPRSTNYRTDSVRSPMGLSSIIKRGKLDWSGKYFWYSSIVRVLPRRYSLYSRPTRSMSSFILVQYPQPFVVKILMSIKNGGRLTPVLYHRALPLGNTSSGKMKFSCGWSTVAIQLRRPSFKRMFLVQKVSNSGSSAARSSCDTKS